MSSKFPIEIEEFSQFSIKEFPNEIKEFPPSLLV